MPPNAMSTGHRSSPRGRTRGTGSAICAALMLAGGCGGPAAPSADLRGNWDFSFSAFDEASCTVSGGITRGCAGSGSLEFFDTRPHVRANHAYRASCQSCELVAEYGIVDQPLGTARATGGTLEFMLAACRFNATIPPAPAQTVEGTVVCRPGRSTDPEVNGRWTMSRR